VTFRDLDRVTGASTNYTPEVLSCIELVENYACLLMGGGRATTAHRLAVAKREVESEVRRFRALCAEPESDPQQLAEEGRRFYGWLIEPFAAELKGASHLAVELDGGLGGLPLPALLDRDGKYLGDRYAFSVWSGFGRKITLENSGVLLIADPALHESGSPKFQSLGASVAREKEALIKAFPEARSLEGPAATIEALATALPHAGVIHFAGHGYTGLNDGALILAPAHSDEPFAILRPAQVHGQDWSHCRLVVLSACSTAGDSGGADRPVGLVRAMHRAGVARVAASSWSVDSEATAEFMTVFYAALARRQKPEDALNEARQRVRQVPKWRHPYYWAAFQLYSVSEGETNG
jgi:CHAT domain-containing protein